MYISNQSIGCQSSPLSIIEFLHLHEIVFPFSCGIYLGISFYPGGVVESPKNLTISLEKEGEITPKRDSKRAIQKRRIRLSVELYGN